MIIRRATEKDLDVYCNLLAKFHKASPVRNFARPDALKTFDFLKSSLEKDDIILLLGELDGEIVGITAGLLYPLFFSKCMVVQELWWWLTPKARGKGFGKALFEAIENWAKEKGADALFMIALEDDRSKQMEKIYLKAGFKPMERTFVKEL